MKKTLLILLLLLFYTVQGAWASSVVNVPQQLKTEAAQMDYKSKDTGITKSIAISNYYYANIENNPAAMEVYEILKKNYNFNHDDIGYILKLLNTPTNQSSIMRALNTDGLMPKYLGARFFVLNQPEHLNSIIDTYLLLKDYGVSEKDMANIVKIYTLNHQQPPISVELVKNVLGDDSIPKEDKVYYIYAKLYALTGKKPDIEDDMINAYKIMKQYPDIFKKDSDNSELKDDVYWVMRYYRDKCVIAETVKTIVNDTSIPKNEKLWRILGKLKVYALEDEAKEEHKNYPQILYKMAEEGRPLITYFWENDARKYYEDENILQDVYNAIQLLKKAGIMDFDGDDGKSVLTIHPELCKAEDVTKEVLNDTKIAKNDKAKYIGRRIIREYYKAKDANYSNDYSFYKTSNVAYKAIEKGIVPNFENNSTESGEYDIKKMDNVVRSFDLMKTNSAFKDKYIKELLRYDGYDDFSLYNAVKKVINDKSIKDKDKPDMVFREFLLYKSMKYEDYKYLAEFYDAGILSLNNRLFEDRFYYKREDDVASSIINAAKLMKESPDFSEEDFLYILSEESNNKYIDIGISQVINDSSIKDEDKAIFALANIKKQKYLQEADMPEGYYKAVELNIVPFYNDSNYYLKERDESYYTKLLENYRIMSEDLVIQGEVIKETFKSYGEKENEIINKVLTNDKISNENKIAEIKKNLKSYDDSENAKYKTKRFFRNAGQSALFVITAPYWLPLAIMYSRELRK